MSKEELIITILTILLSGITATIVSNMFYKKQNEKQKKIDLLDDLFGYRYQLADDYPGRQNEIIRAMNRIPIVFNKSQEVITIFDDYKNNPTEDKLITLLKKMCNNAGIDSKGWNDSHIKTVLLGRNLR